MDRTIKFRAWSGQEMIPEYICVEKMPESGRLGVCRRGPGISVEGVMQYTGLKDRNGVEIYEGDIVDAIALAPYEEDTIVSDVISDANTLGTWSVRSGPEYVFGLPISWGGWASLEVIGNIHENPELMETPER